jgi:flagella basal body P-ring formation protein FlgA
MHTLLSRHLLAAGFGLLALPAFADPALKPQVDVAARIVTVGDMFTDAGRLADKPLFLAPAPGTSGMVAIADIRVAAAKAGLAAFDDAGATDVRVSRLATIVDAPMLTKLMADDLKSRGLVPDGVTADAGFDTAIDNLNAAAVPDPVQLVTLRYQPDSGLFSARFQLAGSDQSLDVTGRIDLMVQAPELASTLPSGSILKASDIVMQGVPLRAAQNGNIATLDQLIGKQLQRQSSAGMVLKASDVVDPQIIARSDLVTVYLHAGPLTLTIKGTALNAASLGQPVAVLNASSKKLVHGVARADGAVEVTAGPTSVAGL